MNISSSVIAGNRARGGASGANGAGGAALGGGIGNFMGAATLNVTNTSVAGNLAQGGGGTFGEGLGGGIADFQNGRASLRGGSLAGNRASGAASADGSTGSQSGGGAISGRDRLRVGHARASLSLTDRRWSSAAVRSRAIPRSAARGPLPAAQQVAALTWPRGAWSFNRHS